MFIKFFLLSALYILTLPACFAFTEEILERIEYSKYGLTYPQESVSQRLQRLETDYFGMEQTGSIDSRLELLSKMSDNDRSLYKHPSVIERHVTSPKSKVRKFLENLIDTGAISGFTPPITNSAYNNGYYEESTGSGYYNNYGDKWFDNFNNYKNNYCPYMEKHNFISRNPFDNINQNHRKHRPHRHDISTYRQSYIPSLNHRVRNFYIPPNIQTNSSVHIIRD